MADETMDPYQELAPADEESWRDRPDENSDEPQIALFDVIYWLTETHPEAIRAFESARESIGAEQARRAAFDLAERVVERAIRGRRLPLRGYWGEWQKRKPLVRLSEAETADLSFDYGGQPDCDKRIHGSRFYGRGTYGSGPEEWTGLCFEKADVLAAFPEARPPQKVAQHISTENVRDVADFGFKGMRLRVWESMKQLWGGLPPGSVRPTQAERMIAKELKHKGLETPNDLARMIRHIRKKIEEQ